MPISFGIASSLSIDQNLTVGGTATVASSLTLSGTTASSLLYGNASKAVSSVTLSSNLSLTTGTLALAAALTGINSITSVAGQNLVLALGTGGTALTLTTSTLAATFAGNSIAMAGGSSWTDSGGSATISGGSSGASLVLGQGASGFGTLTTAANQQLQLKGSASSHEGLIFSESATPLSDTNAAMLYAGPNSYLSGTTYGAGVALTTGVPFFRISRHTNLNSAAAAELLRVVQSTGNLLIGTTSETGLTGAGGLRVAATTSAGSSITGSLVVGNLTAATTVGIGGGNINAGGTISATTGGFKASNYLNSTGLTGKIITGDTNQDFYINGSIKMTLSAATTSLSTSTPSTGVGTGALQVAGGIYAGAASYFGGNVTVAGTGVSTIGASGARVLVNGATDDTSTSFQVSGNSSLGSISLQAGPTTYANYKMTFTAQAADEAYIVNFGGYKMLTGEGFNTPEVTKLYSNNTLALTLSSTQAATFAGAVTGLRFIASTSLIAGDFTSTNDVAIVAKSTTAVYNPEIAAFLAPSQLTYGVGGYSNVYCGVAQSAYNSGSLMFSYAGAGSTSNSFGLGIYGQSPALRINGTGVVTIPSTIAGSAGAGALVVSGGIGVAGASYFGGAVSIAPAGAVDAVVSLQSASGQAVGAHWKETSIADRGWLGYAAGSSNLVYRSAAYNSATGTLRLTIDGSTGAATFAGAVTGNSTFSSGVLSTTAGGYKLFDASGYFVNFRPTAARTYVFEGDVSANDYLTSFTNAGTGKHNLAASGTLAITGTATFGGAVTASSLTAPAGIDLTLGTGTSGAAITVLSASNYVGIGTTTPTKKLEVKETENTPVSQTTFWSNSFGGAVIWNPSTTANTVAAIDFLMGPGTASVAAVAGIQESSTLGALGFFTSPGGNIVPERMRISSGGNVLIGTTDSTGLTGAGGLKINSTTAGASNAGALVVAGGISAGQSAQASYFGGAVSIVTTNVLNPFVIDSTSANLATLYKLAGTTKLIFGVSAATNGINTGSVLGDPCFRTVGNILFSTDDGTINALKLSASTGAATFAGAITSTSTGFNSLSGELAIASTKKLYLDGGGDTYIQESAANVLDFYTGAANSLKLTATTATFAGAVTVGGKITSAVSTATGYNLLYDTSGLTTGRGAFAITSTGAGLAFGVESSTPGTSLTGSAAYSSYFGTSNATAAYLITNSVIRLTIDGSTGAATFAGAVTAGGNVLISNPSSSAFSSFQAENNNGGNATIQIGTSGSARAGTYFGSAEGNLSLIFANGTSSTGLGIGTFNAKPLVLGTNNTAALTINATTQAATFAGAGTFGGRIAINAASVGYAGVYLGGILPNTGGDTNGVGYFQAGTFPASYAVGAHSFYSAPASTASVYTLTNMSGFYAAAPTKGAGSTITNLYGVYVEALTQGTNNYAFRSAGAGVVSIGDTATSSSAITGALQVAGGIGVAGASYFGGAVSVTRSVNTLAGSFVATNSNGGTGAGCVFSASNGTSSGWFGISSIGYTTYGILTADSVGIYTDKSIFIASDNPSGRVKIGVGSSIPAVGDFSATGLAVTGTLSSTGAATFAGAVEITGATTLNNDVYQTALKKFYVDSGSNTYFHENSADSFQIVTGGTIAFTLTAGSGLFNGTVIAPAATANKAPLRIPHGTAPTSPTDGDMWTTTAGLFIRINGVTKTVTLT